MWTNIPPRTRLRPSHLNSFPESQLAEILIKTSRLQNLPWKQRGDQTQFLCCSDSCCSGAFVLEFAEPTLELEPSTKCIAWVSFHADWKEHNELWIWDVLVDSGQSEWEQGLRHPSLLSWDCTTLTDTSTACKAEPSGSNVWAFTSKTFNAPTARNL